MYSGDFAVLRVAIWQQFTHEIEWSKLRLIDEIKSYNPNFSKRHSGNLEPLAELSQRVGIGISLRDSLVQLMSGKLVLDNTYSIGTGANSHYKHLQSQRSSTGKNRRAARGVPVQLNFDSNAMLNEKEGNASAVSATPQVFNCSSGTNG